MVLSLSSSPNLPFLPFRWALQEGGGDWGVGGQGKERTARLAERRGDPEVYFVANEWHV